MTPERERLVRAVEEAFAAEQEAYKQLRPVMSAYDKAAHAEERARRALRRYDAAHPEEAK